MGLIPEGVSDTTRCINCWREFAEHEYVKNSLNEYCCPIPCQESYYGFFSGGDPRMFHPDGQDCTEKELSNHKRACALWDEAEAKGETPEPEKCPSGFIFNEAGECVGHVLRTPYGIGTSVYEYQTIFEAADEPDDA